MIEYLEIVENFMYYITQNSKLTGNFCQKLSSLLQIVFKNIDNVALFILDVDLIYQ